MEPVSAKVRETPRPSFSTEFGWHLVACWRRARERPESLTEKHWTWLHEHTARWWRYDPGRRQAIEQAAAKYLHFVLDWIVPARKIDDYWRIAIELLILEGVLEEVEGTYRAAQNTEEEDEQ